MLSTASFQGAIGCLGLMKRGLKKLSEPSLWKGDHVLMKAFKPSCASESTFPNCRFPAGLFDPQAVWDRNRTDLDRIEKEIELNLFLPLPRYICSVTLQLENSVTLQLKGNDFGLHQCHPATGIVSPCNWFFFFAATIGGPFVDGFSGKAAKASISVLNLFQRFVGIS
ncbi:MAG: hypothetical protein KDJ63_00005, partial [Nitratireductor sp.]|nr:hypothetical protein [Nitratireductor sp.]